MEEEKEQYDKEQLVESDIESAILNLTISLCQQMQHRGFSSNEAKLQTSAYLQRIANSLEEITQTTK